MLLDTHVVLWLMADDVQLGAHAREQIRGGQPILASTASLWEIAIKADLGKIEAPHDFPDLVEQAGLRWLPVTAAHTWAVRDVTGMPHSDPFDRILAAQATVEDVPLMTADTALLGADLGPRVALVDARR